MAVRLGTLQGAPFGRVLFPEIETIQESCLPVMTS